MTSSIVLLWLVVLPCVYCQFLFDLSNDPFEKNNLYHDIEYAQIKTEITDRLDYFVGVPIIEDHIVPEVHTVFQQAGGVVPWLDFSNKPEKEVIIAEEVFNNQPNIVLMLLDDVGWNDGSINSEESWVQFATPNMEQLANNGIRLQHLYTSWVCGPSRASLMTGKYPYRIGYGLMPEADMNLPVNEKTIAEELKGVGYRTALIGKWHLGFQSWAYTPTFRGFDRFYGYYSGSVGYYSKVEMRGFFDLHDDEEVVVDPNEASNTRHLSELLQEKAADVIAQHAANYASLDIPLFLYYSVPNVHLGANEGLEAPQEYMDRCAFKDPTANEDGSYGQHQAYCALLIMLDEMVGNTVCELESNQLEDNTLLIVVSDNGPSTKQFSGTSNPFRGGKGSYVQGGIRNLAFLYSQSESLIPLNMRGSTYEGLVHLSDWYPSFMSLATQNTWVNDDDDFDGIDVYNAIINGNVSPRQEIFHNFDVGRNKGSMQIGMMKLIIGPIAPVSDPEVEFKLQGDFPDTCIVQGITSGEETPIPIAAPTIAPLKSLSSCDSLGWTNAVTKGIDDTVCSESDVGGGCSGIISWTAAESMCLNVGARLCSLTELMNDEARSIGCQVDNSFIWTSSTCLDVNGDGGNWASFASTATGTPPRCSNTLLGQEKACCCADTGPTPSPAQTPAPTQLPSSSQPTVLKQISVLSCDELGWPEISQGDPLVCGESDLGNGCSGQVIWSEAVSFCEDYGARLCTKDELLNDETRRTGCQGDGNYLWSSTPCENGYSASHGSSRNSVPPICEEPTQTLRARCCADLF